MCVPHVEIARCTRIVVSFFECCLSLKCVILKCFFVVVIWCSYNMVAV